MQNNLDANQKCLNNTCRCHRYMYHHWFTPVTLDWNIIINLNNTQASICTSISLDSRFKTKNCWNQTMSDTSLTKTLGLNLTKGHPMKPWKDCQAGVIVTSYKEQLACVTYMKNLNLLKTQCQKSVTQSGTKQFWCKFWQELNKVTYVTLESCFQHEKTFQNRINICWLAAHKFSFKVTSFSMVT